MPCGAFGLSASLADRVLRSVSAGADIVDVGGVGGTLAGNALSLAAMRAVLGEVLVDDAFARMEDLATTFTNDVRATIAEHDLPWSISQLGARCEYRFCSPAPRDGATSLASADPMLEDFLHLYCVNRGVLMTPFHNMALMCPATTAADVALHGRVFRDAVTTLVG